MTCVLDASAILALLNDEKGADRVAALGQSGYISAVNGSEILTRQQDLGIPFDAAVSLFNDMQLSIVPFDAVRAVAAARLRAATKAYGISLGDRACLALAVELALPVLTADRIWQRLDVGVEVLLIR